MGQGGITSYVREAGSILKSTGNTVKVFNSYFLVVQSNVYYEVTWIYIYMYAYNQGANNKYI